MIPFGEWLPDRPDRDNPGATEAKNVIPIPGGYGPAQALSVYTNALDARCRGLASGLADDLSVKTFAGDAAKLYSLSDATWSDVSTTGGYSTGDDERWVFAEFGRDGRIITATNYSNNIQKFVLATSTAFEDLSVTAPKARHMAVVRDFLVVGNVNDSTDGEVPSRVAWGPQGNPEGVWTPSEATQAGQQDLATGGDITGVVGGEYGSILCKTAIHRMTYVGGSVIYQFDEVVRDRGFVAPSSVATFNNITIGLSEDGFVAFNGETLVDIGDQKVDKWFKDNANPDEYGRICSAIDPAEKLYLCAFPTDSADASTVLVYAWTLNRWSYFEAEIECLGQVLSPGFTLEGLDNVSSSIDALPASLDARRWAGGSVSIGAFDLTHKFGAFGGDTLSAVIETAEVQASEPRRSFVSGVRPIVDGTTTVQLGARALPTDTVTWTSAVAPHPRTGVANFRSDNRYHRARVTTSGDFTVAQGIDLGAIPAGFT